MDSANQATKSEIITNEISKLGELIEKVLLEVKDRNQAREGQFKRLPRCYRCGKLGHIQSSCTQQQQQQRHHPLQSYVPYTHQQQHQHNQRQSSYTQHRHQQQQLQDNTGSPTQRQDGTASYNYSQPSAQPNFQASPLGNFPRSTSRGRGRPL